MYQCYVVYKKHHPHTSSLSVKNDIDLFSDGCMCSSYIPKLTVIEELLNAKHYVIMNMNRINYDGRWKYKGWLLNLQQKNR